VCFIQIGVCVSVLKPLANTALFDKLDLMCIFCFLFIGSSFACMLFTVKLQQLLACSILSALLNEYSGSARTSAIGLTWEQHNKCKSTFEVKIFRTTVEFLTRILCLSSICSRIQCC
jgi:hypothetical protein